MMPLYDPTGGNASVFVETPFIFCSTVLIQTQLVKLHYLAVMNDSILRNEIKKQCE